MGGPLFSLLRVTGLLAAITLLTWIFMIQMPGRNAARAAELTNDERQLRSELQAYVQKLAGDIGERNVSHYAALNAAVQFIEERFASADLRSRRDSYEVNGRECHNLEAVIPGRSPEIVVIGAHYDSVYGAPGANDNATGVAGMLALARRFAKTRPEKTMRFVAFVNEEPPYSKHRRWGVSSTPGAAKRTMTESRP